MKLPKDILKIAALFKASNKKIFVVGGAVRDELLGKIPKDFDLATDALPDETINILKSHFILKEVGKSFGVIIAETSFGTVEIATFREDLSEGRRPNGVKFSTIENDVKRRDLTINAMFFDIDTKEIVDLVEGKCDIRNGIIRTVGDAKLRFKEDALRKLRAIRFSERLNFELHESIKKSFMEDNILYEVSIERIRNEFVNILSTAKSSLHAIKTLEKFNFFDQILPDFNICLDKANDHDHIVTIALILRNENTDKKFVAKLKNLCYSKEEIRCIKFLIDLFKSFRSSDFTDIASLKRVHLICKYEDDLRNERVHAFMNCLDIDVKVTTVFLNFHLSVDGNDVKQSGLVGKQIAQKISLDEEKNFIKLL